VLGCAKKFGQRPSEKPILGEPRMFTTCVFGQVAKFLGFLGERTGNRTLNSTISTHKAG